MLACRDFFGEAPAFVLVNKLQPLLKLEFMGCRAEFFHDAGASRHNAVEFGEMTSEGQ